MPTFDYHCQECGVVTSMLYKFEDRPETLQCHVCGGIAGYKLGSPMVLKASYPDGTKRKGWAEIREANKLVREAAVSKSNTAKEIRQEIKKMGVKIEK